jgi:hypothetical protein
VLRKTTPFSHAGMAIVCVLLAARWLPAQKVEPGKPKNQPAAHVVEAAPSQRLSLPAAPVVGLGPIDDSVREQARKKGMLQVGVHRPVTTAMMALGAWNKNTDGTTVWRVVLQSNNAVGLRVHFTNFSVGDGKVWVHDTANPPKQTFGPYTALGVHGNGDMWTEAVFADSVEVEFQPGTQAQSSGLPPFQIAEIAHLYRFGGREAPLKGAAVASSPDSFYILGRQPLAATTAAAQPNYSCFVDATCEEGNAAYPAVSLVTPATAFLLFTQGNSEYQCSGTMLNAPNGQPVLLSAGHCINSNAVALSLTAAFGYQTSTCNGTMPDPSQSPQVLGVQLLAFDENPFESQDTLTEILDDLDYSLTQMSGYPSTSNFILAGYSTDEVLFGENVTSLSYPQGLSVEFAYAPRVDSRLDQYGATPYAKAYQIEYSTPGRIDSGSSGSPLLDNEGHVLGSLSTGVPDCNNPDSNGNCPANSTACDVTAFPYDTWYSKFSAIYEQISGYLEQPLPPVLATNPTVFSATPNPIYPTGGSTLGTTTLIVNAPSTTTSVQIRIGSPTGTLFYASNSPTGQAVTGNWVSNGLEFYLQDTSSGKTLSSANTLGIVTAQVVSAPTLTASPSTITTPNGSPLGMTTLSWTAPGHTGVEVLVGSPTGPVFAAGGPTGSATTGYWVSDGTTFYLVDENTLAVLASTVVHVSQNGASTVSPGGVGSPTFYLNPNPIQVPQGQSLGTTTVNWNAGSVSNVQVRVGSPTGTLLANGGPTGSAATGNWVGNGETFYLINGATQAVLATATAQLTSNVLGLGNSMLQIAPNPIPVPAGQTLGTALISWSTSVSSQVEVHINAPDGPLFTGGGSTGSATATGWVNDGMVFYLQDVTATYTSSDQLVSYPLTLQYTLATATAHLVQQ